MEPATHVRAEIDFVEQRLTRARAMLAEVASMEDRTDIEYLIGILERRLAQLNGSPTLRFAPTHLQLAELPQH